eukprot:11170378-Lingulodinium_polyedra.AAC.1
MDGDGLFANRDALEGLVQVQPCMEVSRSQLKIAYMHLVRQSPKCNSTKYPNKVWAGLEAER